MARSTQRSSASGEASSKTKPVEAPRVGVHGPRKAEAEDDGAPAALAHCSPANCQTPANIHPGSMLSGSAGK